MLKRSKSEVSLLAFCACLFLAQALFAHFSFTSDLSKNFLTVVEPEPRGRPGTTKGVRVVYLYRMTWRATPVEGPSTMAYSE